MKFALFSFVIIVSIVSILLISENEIDWNEKDLSWHSYEDGLKELERNGSNGILILYADWCGTCKSYSRQFNDADVVNALNGIVLIRSNVDTEPQLSEMYNLDGDYVPRTFALSSDGKIIKSLYPEKKYRYFIPDDDKKSMIDFVRKIREAKPYI